MLLCLLVSEALACGGFFCPEDLPVYSDAQQAIFELGEGGVTVEYGVA